MWCLQQIHPLKDQGPMWKRNGERWQRPEVVNDSKETAYSRREQTDTHMTSQRL